MQESSSDRQDSARPGLDAELAHRLDRLSRADAERVLERAIHIQSQRHLTETFTPEQVRRIAREVGLDDAVVERAMRQEIVGASAGETRGWLAPRRIAHRAAVTGPAAEVEDRVMAWMENEEGLRPVARSLEGVRWEKDTHWLTSTRLAFGSEATKSLRGMSEVSHRIIPLDATEHVVEIGVDTRNIGYAAWGIGAGLAALGVGGGIAVAGAVPGGNDLAQFLSVAAPAAVVAATSAVVTAKAWSASIRRGVTRALSGIAHPELHRRAARRREHRRRREDERRRGSFQRLVEEVVEAIDDLFD